MNPQVIFILKLILILTAGPLFIIAAILHAYARIKLKPPPEEMDAYYFEVEHMNPDLARYRKWTRSTYTAAIIAMAMLFLGLII
ncbi:hypothetical protein STSP2_02723 [Anaerohalosphaera lusitana]|uniref:Uncharacterized protein n=1 Tax=Anaerohalosphaera lusitana TaxID=1936003 RepID=A0A1U9NNK7_9BACT|nr:hypothetical protein [Anaerohalosphaera lusitana]AQT69532.1 hypothetical protein STSP2_02723 [Anaerohalosphaera lusitana]